jgi:hypothetical protein
MKRIGLAGLVLVALLFAAQVASAQESLPDCPWGYAYNPISHDMVLVCLDRPSAATKAAAKPAGLAQPAPAPVVDREQSSHCASFAGPNYSICVVAASTASVAKPAGLAQPAPLSGSNQSRQDCPWGYPAYDAATRAFVSQCASR